MLLMELKKHKTIYFNLEDDIKPKIAAFDLDYTLIKPKSKYKFPRDANDWKLLYGDKTKEYLTKLVNNEYSIVIFTNQKGISKKKMTIGEFQQKINDIRNELEINFSIFISTDDDKYRKPLTGMWNTFLRKSKIIIDKTQSFYVGDAAGRVYKKKKDHSSDDKYFAFNIKLNFFTPEIFFDVEEGDHTIKKFKIKKLKSKRVKLKTKKNLVLLVGAPASGKSTYAKKYFKKYKIISRDKLQSKNKCLQIAEENMLISNNIVIDNTNPSKIDRSPYLKLADKYDYNKYIINFDIPKDSLNYMNKYRTEMTGCKIIPSVVYNIFKKKYQEPENEEGVIFNIENNYIDPNYKF